MSMFKSFFVLTKQYLCPLYKIYLRTWLKFVVDISVFSPYHSRPPLLFLVVHLIPPTPPKN